MFTIVTSNLNNNTRIETNRPTNTTVTLDWVANGTLVTNASGDHGNGILLFNKITSPLELLDTQKNNNGVIMLVYALS